jgi:hypothetical protein
MLFPDEPAQISPYELSSPPAISQDDGRLARSPMPLVPGPTPADYVGAHAHTAGYAHPHTAATAPYTPTHTRQPGPYQHSNLDPYVYGHGHGHGVPAWPRTLVTAASTPGTHASWPAPSASSYEAAAMAEDEQSYSHRRATTDPYTYVHDFPVRPAALVAAASMPGALAFAHTPGAPPAPARRAHTYAPQPAHSAFPHGPPVVAAAAAAERGHISTPRTHAHLSGAVDATMHAPVVPGPFKYLTCTGRRRALCVCRAPPPKAPGGAANAAMTQIGINYAGTPNALRGCVNDARNVRKFLSGGSCRVACLRNLMLSASAQSTRTSTLATSSC